MNNKRKPGRPPGTGKVDHQLVHMKLARDVVDHITWQAERLGRSKTAVVEEILREHKRGLK